MCSSDLFVVLTHADAQRITLLDPAMGERTMTLQEASPHFTGVALELAPGPSFRQATARTPFDWRVLFTGQRGLGRAFTQMAVLSLVLEVFTILMPMLSQWVVDDVVVTRDTPLLTVLCVAAAPLLYKLYDFNASGSRLALGWSGGNRTYAVPYGTEAGIFRAAGIRGCARRFLHGNEPGGTEAVVHDDRLPEARRQCGRQLPCCEIGGGSRTRWHDDPDGLRGI